MDHMGIHVVSDGLFGAQLTLTSVLCLLPPGLSCLDQVAEAVYGVFPLDGHSVSIGMQRFSLSCCGRQRSNNIWNQSSVQCIVSWLLTIRSIILQFDFRMERSTIFLDVSGFLCRDHKNPGMLVPTCITSSIVSFEPVATLLQPDLCCPEVIS